MKTKRIWRVVSISLMMPALLAWIYATGLESDYAKVLPRLPNPTVGRVYPRNIHGVVVFQTYAERMKVNLTEGISIGVFFVGLLIGGLEERHWKRTSPKGIPSAPNG